MTESIPIILLVAMVVLLVLGVVGLTRLSALGRTRDDATRDAAEARARIDALGTQVAHVESDIRQDFANARTEQANTAAGLRNEVGGAIGKFREATQQQLTDMAGLQQRQLQGFGEQLAKLTLSNEQRLDAVRVSVEQRLDALRVDNAAKLEQMRATVDEKLQATLEQRLGESFKIVSDRLEQVHRGLGEMQTLAAGVGDLKRVLSNVKTRGMWGEVQLAALLAEVLTPQQYGTNVETVPNSNKRVEFAIRLPGRGDDGRPCWLRWTPSFRSGMAKAAGCPRARRRPRGGYGAQGARRVPACAGEDDPRILCIAAFHDRFRHPVRADGGPVRGDDGARGLCRDAAAGVSRHADGAHEFPRAAQQPANGLSHSRH